MSPAISSPNETCAWTGQWTITSAKCCGWRCVPKLRFIQMHLIPKVFKKKTYLKLCYSAHKIQTSSCLKFFVDAQISLFGFCVSHQKIKKHSQRERLMVLWRKWISFRQGHGHSVVPSGVVVVVVVFSVVTPSPPGAPAGVITAPEAVNAASPVSVTGTSTVPSAKQRCSELDSSPETFCICNAKLRTCKYCSP